jgi:hypothetical protein
VTFFEERNGQAPATLPPRSVVGRRQGGEEERWGKNRLEAQKQTFFRFLHIFFEFRIMLIMMRVGFADREQESRSKKKDETHGREKKCGDERAGERGTKKIARRRASGVCLGIRFFCARPEESAAARMGRQLGTVSGVSFRLRENEGGDGSSPRREPGFSAASSRGKK